MSGRRAKASGWAAFDQQQKQKDVVQARISNEPFPSLPSAPAKSFQKTEASLRNKHLPMKPFSSVVQPLGDFPAPGQDTKKSEQSEVGSSGGRQSSEISGYDKFGIVFRRLKQLYSWADDSLIEDIMAAAGNDFDTASSFLKAMVSHDNLEEHKDATIENLSSDSMEVVSDGRESHKKNEIGGTLIVSEPAKARYDLEASVENDKKNGKKFDHSARKLFDECMEINTMLGQLTYVPIEPEWEEDDVYLSCRKDALKVMRAAARHSKAATNFFSQGDHYSAQQFSLKAKEEWEAAKRLNTKAAREILSIRNKENGIWRLDLHGLHTSEAVQAVHDHLHMIETQAYCKGVSNENGFGTKAEATHTLSVTRGNNMRKLDQHAFRRQHLKWLEVITGIGNHSRGAVALPAAIRTFLTDNGYRFDETRPGIITVRPKFRPN